MKTMTQTYPKLAPEQAHKPDFPDVPDCLRGRSKVTKSQMVNIILALENSLKDQRIDLDDTRTTRDMYQRRHDCLVEDAENRERHIHFAREVSGKFLETIPVLSTARERSLLAHIRLLDSLLDLIAINPSIVRGPEDIVHEIERLNPGVTVTRG